MKTTLQDAKYNGLKLDDVVYGDDDPQVSTQQAQALLQVPEPQGHRRPDHRRHRRRRPGRARSQEDRLRQVRDRPRLPQRHGRYVKDGNSPVFALWSVTDLGYLAYVVADKLVKGEITGKEGETFTVPGLNNDQPYTIGKDGVVILGPAFRFNKDNIDQYVASFDF